MSSLKVKFTRGNAGIIRLIFVSCLCFFAGIASHAYGSHPEPVEAASGHVYQLMIYHALCLVGQAVPTPALKYYVDPAKPLPGKMDFWLGDPFTADDVVELVARYDNGEAGPPPGWNGLFIDPKDLNYSGIDPKQLAWTDNAMIEDMRSRLTPENFNKWLEMIQPGLLERLKRAEDWHNSAPS